MATRKPPANSESKFSTNNINNFFDGKLIGQDHVVEYLTDILQAGEIGLVKPNAPLANVFLAGPTGVGKTETVHLLAELIHGNPNNVLKINCGEYQLNHEVAKLIGAPPGYLGHRETTPVLSQQKLNAVKSAQSNIGIVLFDEIEKANDGLYKLLLGVMDKGELALGDNTKVNFNGCLIFYTSNLGVITKNPVNFVNTSKVNQEDVYLKEIKKHFSPEFFNRLDKTIIYKHLTKDNITAIFKKMFYNAIHLSNTSHLLKSIPFQLTERYADAIINEGYSIEYGARNLDRAISKYFRRPLAKQEIDNRLLTQAFTTSKIVLLDIDKDNNTVFKLVSNSTYASV